MRSERYGIGAGRMGWRGVAAALALAVALVVPGRAYASVNHTQNEAVSWANARAAERWNVDYDGAYGVQCVDLILAYYDYLVGWHASGNAIDYTGNALPAGWTRVSSPRAGDVVVWNKGAQLSSSAVGGGAERASSTYGHIGIVTEVRNGYIVSVETNTYYTGKPAAAHDRLISGVACYIRPDFNIIQECKGVLDNAWGGNGTFRVAGWAFDPMSSGASIPVHVYIGGSAGSGASAVGLSANLSRDDVNSAFGISGKHGFDNTFRTTARGQQELYLYAIAESGNGPNPEFGHRTVTINPDTVAPVISNAKATRLTDTTYRVEFDVYDNLGQVVRISLPSWNCDWEDAVWFEVSPANDGKDSQHVTYVVDTTKLKGGAVAGTYITDIYCWDFDGNECVYEGGSSGRRLFVNMGSPFEDAEVEIKDQTYTGSALTPEPTVRLDDRVLRKGFHYDVEYENNVNPGTATVAISGLKGYAGGTIKKTFRIIGHDKDGWIDLAGGHKGYVKRGKLVKGWLSIGSSKYWFGDDGVMATGWTDVEASGKTMRYYFNPASGNLARGTWMTIGGQKYYFRPSGNMATGFADIDDSGTTKKYYFDSEGQMLTGWQEIEVNGKPMRYYFRPAGSMATGWATIDGQKYFFRASGNMATGFTTVTDGSKRYFHEDGTMHVGWLELSGRTYYFRDPFGSMVTGKAIIDGVAYEFTDSGTLGTSLTVQNDGVELSVRTYGDADGGEGRAGESNEPESEEAITVEVEEDVELIEKKGDVQKA